MIFQNVSIILPVMLCSMRKHPCLFHNFSISLPEMLCSMSKHPCLFRFFNISEVMINLVGGLKMKIIVSISPESTISALKVEKQLVKMLII